MNWKRSTAPVSSLNRASSSRLMPKVRLAAVRMACSSVSIRMAGSMPLSLLTWSMMLCSESVPCCMGVTSWTPNVPTIVRSRSSETIDEMSLGDLG